MQPCALATTTSGFVPAAPLDNMLVPIGATTVPTITFHSTIDGEPLNAADSWRMFEIEMIARTAERRYATTDHLIYTVRIDGMRLIYVSLDNSVRANKNGYPLTSRLAALCSVIRNVIITDIIPAIVFFSEACRPSINEEAKTETPWFEMRRIIERECNLMHVHEFANNDGAMSFGLAMFAQPRAYDRIQNIYARRLLTDGFGSVALGIKLGGLTYWAVHFPLDFTEDVTTNKNLITLRALCCIMTEYPGSVAAFGDFNMIPGWLNEQMREVAAGVGMRFTESRRTFYGAFYDVVPIPADGVPVDLAQIV